MYFDRRLWQLTRGLRGWIALAVLLGIVASVVGIARFAILGVLLSRVFDGAGVIAVAIPALGVAVAVALRGIVDHHRTMISHRTAAQVFLHPRGRAVGDHRAMVIDNPAQGHRNGDSNRRKRHCNEARAVEYMGEQHAEDRKPRDPDHRGNKPEKDRQGDPTAQSARQLPQASVEIHQRFPVSP